MAALECFDQVALHHQLAAGRVDQRAPFFHLGQRLPIDDAVRLLAVRAVQAQVIAAGQQVVETYQFDAVLPDEFQVREFLAGDDLHLHGDAAKGRAAADATESQQTQGLAADGLGQLSPPLAGQ
jgi:hypothetical protein